MPAKRTTRKKTDAPKPRGRPRKRGPTTRLELRLPDIVEPYLLRGAAKYGTLTDAVIAALIRTFPDPALQIDQIKNPGRE